MNAERLRLKISLIILLGALVFGALGFMLIEKTSPLDAIYFMIVTLATVGYGDIHPSTPSGKILVLVIIIMGVGSFLGVIANATELMLSRKIKQSRLEKLNMVVGVFFSEVGVRLLSLFARQDPGLQTLQAHLIIAGDWTSHDFLRARKDLRTYAYQVEVPREFLQEARHFLSAKRDFLAGLLVNPALHEHESFTDALRAISHLAEELAYREDFGEIPESDRNHLATDIQRVYRLIVDQWIIYMKHLKENFPYLFSLAVRVNPFSAKASPIVTA